MTPLSFSAILLALGAYLGFSTFDSITRLLMLAQNPISQAQVLTCAMLVGLVPILGFIHHEQQWHRLKPKQPRLILLRAAISVVQFWCLFYTFRHLPLAQCYVLFFTAPIWTALIGAVALGEHLHKRQLFAIAICFTGSLVANWPSEANILGWGHVTGLCAAFLGAISMVLMRHLGKTESTGTVLLSYIGSLLLANALTMTTWQPISHEQIALLGLAGLAMGLAHVSFFYAVRLAPAPIIAPFQYTQILWALLYGTVLFHEPVQPRVIIGLLLIASGGWLLIRKKRA